MAMDKIEGTTMVPVPSSPISKSCANCSLECDYNKPSSAVYIVKDLRGRVKKLSTFEALVLILKGSDRFPPPRNSVNTKARKDISLCAPCGVKFAKLLHVYQDFMSLTAVGSFVKSLNEKVLPPGGQKKTVRAKLKVNRKEAPSVPFNGFLEAPKKVGGSPIPSTSKRKRKSPIRTKSEPFPGNMDIHGDCELDSGELHCDAELLINTDRASPAQPGHQSPKKRPRRSENEEKKIPRKRKRTPCIPNPLGRTAPAPCHLPEEDRQLLITTSYKCDECLETPQAFETLQGWVLHYLETHQQDLGYGDADGIRNRPDLFTSDGLRRPCPECGRKLSSNTSMLYHIKVKHLYHATATCEVCKDIFLKKESLQKHIEKHHSNYPEPEPTTFLCTLCGSTFKRKGTFAAHKRGHLSIVHQRFSCHICHRKYATRPLLKLHIASHSDERPFKCSYCPLTFKTGPYLKNHVAYKHNPSAAEKEPHVCEFCGKEYRWNRKSSLKKHLKTIHFLSNEESKVSAELKLKNSSFFRALEDEDRILPQTKIKSKTCSLCEETCLGWEDLFTHLSKEHGKTLEEATEITGLGTTRLGKLLSKSYPQSSSNVT